MIEGSDAAGIEEQITNIDHCPFPSLDHNTYPERFHRGPSVYYRVCGTRRRPDKMVLYDKCNQRYHLWCLDKPLLRVREGGQDEGLVRVP